MEKIKKERKRRKEEKAMNRKKRTQIQSFLRKLRLMKSHALNRDFNRPCHGILKVAVTRAFSQRQESLNLLTSLIFRLRKTYDFGARRSGRQVSLGNRRKERGKRVWSLLRKEYSSTQMIIVLYISFNMNFK